jgi:hypothetical protein
MGLEPTAFGVTGWRYDRLSYDPAFWIQQKRICKSPLGLVCPAVFEFLALDVLLDEVADFGRSGGRDSVRRGFDDCRGHGLRGGAVTRVTTVTTHGSINNVGKIILAPLECGVDDEVIERCEYRVMVPFCRLLVVLFGSGNSLNREVCSQTEACQDKSCKIGVKQLR